MLTNPASFHAHLEGQNVMNNELEQGIQSVTSLQTRFPQTLHQRSLKMRNSYSGLVGGAEVIPTTPNEAYDLSGKSPLSLLNEMCSQIRVTPNYDITEDGPIHDRKFKCRASFMFNNQIIEGTGMGATKKEAKQLAAKVIVTSFRSNASRGYDTLDGHNGVDQSLVDPKFNDQMTSRMGTKDPTAQTTPVSFLNELCSRAKVTPVFNFFEEGPVHNRSYECQITVDSDNHTSPVAAKGVGKTKKDAKQEAARSLLNTLYPHLTDRLSLQFPKTESTYQPDCDPDVPGNPVGELNEFCLKTKKVVPEYVEEPPEGDPHVRIFTVTCQLGPKIIEKGRGKSKKQAKRVAAHKMLQRVMEMVREQDTSKTDEIDSSIQERLNNLSIGGEKKYSPVEIMQNYRARTGKVIEMIRNEGCLKGRGDDPVKILKAVSEEQNWNLDWLDVQDVGDAEKFQLLFMGMDPKLIIVGRGENRNKCKKNAAENALLFLRSSLT